MDCEDSVYAEDCKEECVDLGDTSGTGLEGHSGETETPRACQPYYTPLCVFTPGGYTTGNLPVHLYATYTSKTALHEGSVVPCLPHGAESLY